jgi:hypothetical protein
MKQKYCDNIKNDTKIIIAFLKSPHNNIGPFYELCYRHTRSSLLSLRRQGYVLPQVGSDYQNNLVDLTIDILAELLSSPKGRPYCIVHDYFDRKGINPQEIIDASKVYHLFTVLIRGFARQELFRITGLEDPQIKNLKRRFKDILKDPDYQELTLADKKVFSLRAIDPQKENKPIIPYDELLNIVENAYHNSNSRVEWCRNIFSAVNKCDKYQNAIYKHELLRAVIEINHKYVDIEYTVSQNPDSINLAIIRKAGEKAIPKTIKWVSANVVDEFIRKKRITSAESESFLKAVRSYLEDFGYNGDADKYPRYYFEQFPNKDQDYYLKNHKYPFETTVNAAHDYFLDVLRNDSTISGFGDY